MKSRHYVLLVLGLVLLVACQPGPSPKPTSLPAVTPPPTRAVAVTVPAKPDSTAEGEDATADPANRPSGSLPLSGLFDTDWADRSPFQAGLVNTAQPILDELPGATVYHMDFEIADSLTYLQGRQEVWYTNRTGAALDEIAFRTYPGLLGGALAVSDVTVNGAVAEPAFEALDSAMRVPLPQPLQLGEQVVIAMDFEVTVPVSDERNYGSFAYLNDVLALAHFYPMIPAYDGDWDLEVPAPQGDLVVADPAFFLVRVTAPADLVIASSGVTLGGEGGDGKQALTIAAGPVRDFYLAASGRYAVVSEQVGEITVNSYAYPELVEGSRQALAYAVAALQSFSDRFGPYPFTELDLVSTPTSALGIEYPGITALADSIYQGDRLANYMEGTTAHEVGHQWFYNVVGNDQLLEPWLDEALTQYVTMLYFQDRYGQAGYDGFRQSLTGRWDRVDRADIPIGLPVDAYQGREYGAIVYGRGPLFFEALKSEMGSEAFDRFLTDYPQVFEWEMVTTERFRALAEERCDCDLGELFAAWVYGE